MRKFTSPFLFTLVLISGAASAQVADKANEAYKTHEGRENLAKGLGDPTREERQRPRDRPKNWTATIAIANDDSAGRCDAREMSHAEVAMSPIPAPIAPAPSRVATASRPTAGRARPTVRRKAPRPGRPPCPPTSPCPTRPRPGAAPGARRAGGTDAACPSHRRLAQHCRRCAANRILARCRRPECQLKRAIVAAAQSLSFYLHKLFVFLINV